MRGDVRRLVLAAIGGLSAVLLLVAMFDRGIAMRDSSASPPFGWIIALASVAVIAGVAWFLLSLVPRHSADGGFYASTACASCGRTVLTDWRLCPYCGSALTPRPMTPDGQSTG
jgi:hypothetical protein